MNKRVKFTALEKMLFVLKFRELNISLLTFCRLYSVESTAIHRWSIKYDHGELEKLEGIKIKTLYSSHTLINSIQDYLTGEFSMLQIVKKYKLSGEDVLGDNRGIRKDESQLSNEEILKKEIKN